MMLHVRGTSPHVFLEGREFIFHSQGGKGYKRDITSFPCPLLSSRCGRKNDLSDWWSLEMKSNMLGSAPSRSLLFRATCSKGGVSWSFLQTIARETDMKFVSIKLKYFPMVLLPFSSLHIPTLWDEYFMPSLLSSDFQLFHLQAPLPVDGGFFLCWENRSNPQRPSTDPHCLID